MSTTYPDVDCTQEGICDAYDESAVYMAGRSMKVSINCPTDRMFDSAEALLSNLFKRYRTDCIGATIVASDATFKQVEVRFELSDPIIVDVYKSGEWP